MTKLDFLEKVGIVKVVKTVQKIGDSEVTTEIKKFCGRTFDEKTESKTKK